MCRGNTWTHQDPSALSRPDLATADLGKESDFFPCASILALPVIEVCSPTRKLDGGGRNTLLPFPKQGSLSKPTRKMEGITRVTEDGDLSTICALNTVNVVYNICRLVFFLCNVRNSNSQAVLNSMSSRGPREQHFCGLPFQPIGTVSFWGPGWACSLKKGLVGGVKDACCLCFCQRIALCDVLPERVLRS